MIMICSIILPTYSLPAKAAEDNFKTSTEEISSLADFETVDNLIEQRADALTEGNMNKYHKLSEDLKKLGCEDISAGEVQQITGKNPENLLSAQSPSKIRTFNYGIGTYSAASTNVTFSKVITKVKYKGKQYKVMKITASPTGMGTLFKTGSVALAKYIVAMDIPYLKVKKGKRYSDIAQKKYQKWIKAPNYGNVNYAISYFLNGTEYNSWLFNVNLNGCNGKQIHNVYLQHPSTAMQLGYWN